MQTFVLFGHETCDLEGDRDEGTPSLEITTIVTLSKDLLLSNFFFTGFILPLQQNMYFCEWIWSCFD